MSMHLEGPWLSTTNTKKRKKPKFKSAEHKAKALEAAKSWEELLKKHKINLENTRKERGLKAPPYQSSPSYQRQTPHYPSLNSPDSCGVAAKKPSPVYTGTLIKGIATMHKSNAVPVLNEEQATEIAKMRR